MGRRRRLQQTVQELFGRGGHGGRAAGAGAAHTQEHPAAPEGSRRAPDALPAGADRALAGTLADLATEVWRLRQRLRRLGEPSAPALRALWHSAQRLEQVLAEAGVEIEDPAGRPYDPGSSLEVVHVDLPRPPGQAGDAERAPAWPALEVRETIAPIVRVCGRMVRHGQVVLGGPASAAGTCGSRGAHEERAGHEPHND